MCVQPFLSTILICSNTGETHSLNVFSASLVFLICWRDSQPGCVFTAIPVRSSDMLEHWRVTYNLNASWCSVILVSSSDRLKHWVTHLLDIQPFLSVVLISSNTGQRLTCWMCVPFLSGSDLFKYWRVTHMLDVCSTILVRFWSAQTLESNSQTGCGVFSHSSQ